jgi:hypothetical protein
VKGNHFRVSQTNRDACKEKALLESVPEGLCYLIGFIDRVTPRGKLEGAKLRGDLYVLEGQGFVFVGYNK